MLNISKFTNVFTSYFNGLARHSKALRFILANGLTWYFLFPILLNVLFFIGGFSLVSDLSNSMLEGLNEALQQINWGLDPEGWLYRIIYGIVWLSLRILYFLLFAYLGGYLVLIFLSPALALLSERVEQLITGQKVAFSSLRYLNNIMRGIAIAIRNFVIEIILIIAFLLLSLIPPLGLIVPFALFFISAYFYGFSMMDYPLEGRKYGVTNSARFMFGNKGSATSIGTPLAIVLLVPFVGSLLAGFFAIISVVAGTMETLELLDQKKPEKY